MWHVARAAGCGKGQVVSRRILGTRLDGPMRAWPVAACPSAPARPGAPRAHLYARHLLRDGEHLLGELVLEARHVGEHAAHPLHLLLAQPQVHRWPGVLLLPHAGVPVIGVVLALAFLVVLLAVALALLVLVLLLSLVLRLALVVEVVAAVAPGLVRGDGVAAAERGHGAGRARVERVVRREGLDQRPPAAVFVPRDRAVRRRVASEDLHSSSSDGGMPISSLSQPLAGGAPRTEATVSARVRSNRTCEAVGEHTRRSRRCSHDHKKGRVRGPPLLKRSL
mmetsp:Transcript_91200/g.260475  ORF Transcript_91200/g.260475 Transcript_91200/m.260475 type:complete len:280 (+) Transcript_91200:454-1293(+)